MQPQKVSYNVIVSLQLPKAGSFRDVLQQILRTTAARCNRLDIYMLAAADLMLYSSTAHVRQSLARHEGYERKLT